MRLLRLLIYIRRTQAYGAAGVVKAVRILEREIKWGMRLLGVRKVEELTPEMVRTFERAKYTLENVPDVVVPLRLNESTGSRSIPNSERSSPRTIGRSKFSRCITAYLSRTSGYVPRPTSAIILLAPLYIPCGIAYRKMMPCTGY